MSITKISDYAAASNHASNIATIADEMKKTLDNTGR